LFRVRPGLENREEEQNMRKYETIYILQPDLSEEEIKVIADKVQDVIASYKGDFLRLEDWGVRKMAYVIRKFARGRYLYLRYNGGRELIAELERRLRLDEKVLRYQSVNITDQPEKPVAEKKELVVEPEGVEPIEATEAATTPVAATNE
jgi:small subunit ribosomal protein S6